VVDSVDPGDPANGIPPTFKASIPYWPSPFLINIPYYTDNPTNPNNPNSPNPPPPNNYPGNPGPQTRFNPRDYPWIVRHFSILN
jgi:hypothetical protein